MHNSVYDPTAYADYREKQKIAEIIKPTMTKGTMTAVIDITRAENC